MTQLRRDAAYIRTGSSSGRPMSLTSFDEEVYETLSSAQTVVSCTKALARTSSPPAARSPDDWEADLESRVADSMLRLLQADRIELSPDS
ncbi:MAG TPA: hypothetical protein VGD45_21510 [Steroidobacter sp.]|uniref:hypothetical protein n=1 Tax=Steroidobacter sp. TaxID=1978227 RepID=UPI002ED7DB2B